MKKEEKKVPQLRFPKFAGDWEQRKLPEFVSFFNGFPPMWIIERTDVPCGPFLI